MTAFLHVLISRSKPFEKDSKSSEQNNYNDLENTWRLKNNYYGVAKVSIFVSSSKNESLVIILRLVGRITSSVQIFFIL